MKNPSKRECNFVRNTFLMILACIYSGYLGAYIYNHKFIFHWPFNWPVSIEEIKPNPVTVFLPQSASEKFNEEKTAEYSGGENFRYEVGEHVFIAKGAIDLDIGREAIITGKGWDQITNGPCYYVKYTDGTRPLTWAWQSELREKQ